MLRDQNSVVIVATCYRLDGPEIGPLWGMRFSIPIQTSPGALPASYSWGTGSLSWGRAAGMW